MKVIALYLPQFHEIAENDEWWGEGYTEWTAVKAGEPCFEGHYQPHIPLHGNYYNLLDKNVMRWQTDLMKKYNVYGMCFYHYYFGNGRRVLEKPAENLLEWRDIDMPFCFMWANETWARSWSKVLEKVEWNNLREPQKDVTDNDGILIKQEYGDEDTWREHFEYLIPFFKDRRYIKIDNQPVFMIYQPKDICCMENMKSKWNEWAKEQGFEKIYFIGVGLECKNLDARLQHEPKYSNLLMPKKNNEYTDLCDQIITNAFLAEDECYFCGTPGYDDTPRRGALGNVFSHSTPEQFYKQMKALMYLSKKKGNEFIFVNAWNEWGEGMHLEPDEKYQYQYLEAVKNALCDFHEFGEEDKAELGTIVDKGIIEQVRLYQKHYSKTEFICNTLEQLLNLNENGESIGYLLKKNGYERIAVYGLGRIGKHVVAELNNSDVQIIYGVDQNAWSLNFNFPLYTIDDILPQVDLILITINDDKIYKKLREKYEYPVGMITDFLKQDVPF